MVVKGKESSTSARLKHLNRFHPQQLRKLRLDITETACYRRRGPETAGEETHGPQAAASATGSASMRLSRLDDSTSLAIEKAILNLLIGDLLPFSLVDSDNFRALFTAAGLQVTPAVASRDEETETQSTSRILAGLCRRCSVCSERRAP